MRLLILSQYYKPDPISKHVELTQELRQWGHMVSALTGFRIHFDTSTRLRTS